MEDHQRDVIRDNWTWLLERIILDTGLNDHLLESGVFNQDMLDMIECKQPRRRQCQEFFNILLRRGPESFDKFIDALRKTSQGFIADKLLNSLSH